MRTHAATTELPDLASYAGYLAGSIADLHLPGAPLGPVTDDDDDDDGPGGTSVQDGCEPDTTGYWEHRS
jgi:hypothetical protein